MISRRFRPAAVAALGVVAALASACGGSATSGGTGSDQPAAQSAPSAGTAVDVPVGSQIMNLPLVTSTGKRTSLAAYPGKIVVISDAMTLCQETCPLDTANVVQFARAVDKAGLSDKAVFLSITVDPARDTPAQLAAYRALYKPVPDNWLMLTGKQADLAALWKHFGVWWKKVPQDGPPPKNWRTGRPLTYDIEHSDELFLLKDGHERYVFTGAGHIEPGTLPGPMRGFLDEHGVKNLEHPGADSWTVAQALQAMSALTGKHLTD